MGVWVVAAVFAAGVFFVGRQLMELLSDGTKFEVRMVMGLEFLTILSLTSAVVIAVLWGLPWRA